MAELRSPIPTENRLLIDWLTFTITDYSVQDICNLLEIDSSELINFTGRYGYKVRLSYGGINILLDGPLDSFGKKNICVEMSGQGCRDFETLGNANYLQIFKLSIEGKCKITRLDIAYDDVVGYLPFDIIIKKSIDLAEVVSIWRSWTVTQSDKGASVTYGSRQSDCFNRIYDKAAERGYDNSCHWIRCETVFKENLATKVADLIYHGTFDSSFYFSLLKDKVRFVEPSDDSNKSRWSTSKFWAYLTDNSPNIHLSFDSGQSYNLDSKEYHLLEQYQNTLISILLCHGFDNLVEKIINLDIKLTPKYKAMCLKEGFNSDILSVSALYDLKEKIRQIKEQEFAYYNPSIKVGD